MRVRCLLLNIAAFFACLSLMTSCGPAFKAGRDEDKKPKAEKPADQQAPPPAPVQETPPPSQQAQPDGTSTEATALTTNDLSIEDTKEIAEKLLIGISLTKGENKAALNVVLKDKDTDAKPNIELIAELTTEIQEGVRTLPRTVDFVKLGSADNQVKLSIDESQYSVDYKCNQGCTSIEVNVQRVIQTVVDATGATTPLGFRASFRFEVDATKPEYTLKENLLTNVMTAQAARISAGETDKPATPAPAPGPTPVPTPVPAPSPTPAAKAQPTRREQIVAALKKNNGIIIFQFKNCSDEAEFRRELANFDRQVILKHQRDVERTTGLVLTAEEKADRTLFKSNGPAFTPGSMKCEQAYRRLMSKPRK